MKIKDLTIGQVIGFAALSYVGWIGIQIADELLFPPCGELCQIANDSAVSDNLLRQNVEHSDWEEKGGEVSEGVSWNNCEDKLNGEYFGLRANRGEPLSDSYGTCYH